MHRIALFWKNQSLKRKFLLIVVPGAVFSSVVMIAAAFFIFHVYEKNMYGMTIQNMNMIMGHIEKELNQVDKVSMDIMADPAVQQALKPHKPNVRTKEISMDSIRLTKRMYQVMQEQLQRNSTLVSISIFVEDEWYYVGNTTKTLERSMLPDMKNKIDENTSSLHWYAKSYPADRLYGLRSIKDIYYHTFEDEAILVLEYDLKESITGLLNDSAGIKYSPKLAVLRAGNYLYTDIEDLPEEDILKEGCSGYRTVSVKGHKYFTTCLDNSDYCFSYVFFITYDNLFGAMRFLKVFFLVMAVAVISISILYCEKLTQIIMNRFNHLTFRMRTVQEGNFKAEVMSLPGKGDELEAVCESFEEMVGHVDRLIQDNYVKQMLIRENQLKVLQNQINPHFLFNTLQTISWKARESSQNDISYIVEALGKLLRYTLREDNDPAPLEEEVDILMRYLTIQKTRYEERLTVSIDIPKAVMKQRVPKLVLQSLVENSIKHALEVMLEPCHIQISAVDEAACLILLVRDNGPGIDPSVLEEQPVLKGRQKPGGIGLLNIKQRLKLLFGENSDLLVHNTGKGALIEVRIGKERSS